MTLDDVKNYLCITWDDAGLDSRLASILDRSKSIISSYAGKTLDFDDTQGIETQLLLDCIRYIYNDAFEMFEKNFCMELIALRAKYVIESE